VATRDFVRSELRSVLEELLESDDGEERAVRRGKKKVSDATAALPRISARPKKQAES
jgi:hypothetical protein